MRLNLFLTIPAFLIFLSGCNTELNSPGKGNLKDVSVNLNVKDLKADNLEEIKLDGKILAKTDFNFQSPKIILPKMLPGRHIINFKLKKLGEIEIPLEIKKEVNNNFQLNPLIKDEKVTSWEIGIDSNQDGLIDKGSYFSRDFQSYVLVRDSSGELSYLPKNELSDDFRKNLNSKPADFKFPEIKENEFKNGDVIYTGTAQSNKNVSFNQNDLFTFPFPANVVINLPENLKDYKIDILVFKDTYVSNLNFVKKGTLLIADPLPIRKIDEFQVYLSDYNKKTVMANIKFLAIEKYLINPQPQPTVGGQNVIGNPFADGKPIIEIVKPEDIQISVKENAKLSEEEIKKLKLANDPTWNFRPIPVGKKFALPLPGKNGEKKRYAIVSEVGDILSFVNEDEFKQDDKTIVLPDKESKE